jgi:hypothetical protein
MEAFVHTHLVFSFPIRETGKHCVLESRNLTFMKWERNLNPKPLTQFLAPWTYV